jgi:hypothetical protein
MNQENISYTLKIKELGRVKYNSNLTSHSLFKIVNDFYGIELNLLHEKFPQVVSLLDFETDQSTEIHKKFYELGETVEFLSHYMEFVLNEIVPKFENDGKLLVQKIPSFRVQIPNNIAVAEYHKDSDYSHNIYETNIFLPFTDAVDSATIHAETKANSQVMAPLNTLLNEMYLWDGANCVHGNLVNTSSKSRVSLDFRILPEKYYKKNEVIKSVTTNKKMIVGDYWVEI